MSHSLHPQLASDCFIMGQLDGSTLLLHKNATVPWFILLPHTEQNEIFKLPEAEQQQVHRGIARVAHFIEEHFSADKINIATIGNIVPQLHVHIIGRFVSDLWWPEPIWGKAGFTEYTTQQVEDIRRALNEKQLLNAD